MRVLFLIWHLFVRLKYHIYWMYYLRWKFFTVLLYFLHACPHLGSVKYTEKDTGGMLVWSPYHSIVDSKCKWHKSYPVTESNHKAGLSVTLFCFTVDEYIAIAKEKHGYNVEQVRFCTPPSDPVFFCVFFWRHAKSRTLF